MFGYCKFCVFKLLGHEEFSSTVTGSIYIIYNMYISVTMVTIKKVNISLPSATNIVALFGRNP